MSKLKQDIEDSLIELVDERYKVDVKNNITKYPNGEEDIFSITIRTPFFSGEDINKIEDYLHQCYDFMEMDNYNVFKVTINYSQVFNVKELIKIKVKLLKVI